MRVVELWTGGRLEAASVQDRLDDPLGGHERHGHVARLPDDAFRTVGRGHDHVGHVLVRRDIGRPRSVA